MRFLAIDLTGDYDAFSVANLCRQLEPAYRSTAANLILDLSAVRYMDATCANELIKLSETRAAAAGARTKMIIPDEQTREMFLLLGVDHRSIVRGRIGEAA